AGARVIPITAPVSGLTDATPGYAPRSCWVVRRHVWVQNRSVAESKPYSLVLAREASAALVSAASPGPCVRVTSRADLLAAAKRLVPAIAFVDFDLLPHLEGAKPGIAIVGIVDDAGAEPLRSMISVPWLSHLVSSAMLASAHARAHLEALQERLAY